MTEYDVSGSSVIKPDSKPGVQTTEFWLSLGTQVAALFGAFGVGVDDEIVQAVFGVVALVVPAVYTAMRTKAKA